MIEFFTWWFVFFAGLSSWLWELFLSGAGFFTLLIGLMMVLFKLRGVVCGLLEASEMGEQLLVHEIT